MADRSAHGEYENVPREEHYSQQKIIPPPSIQDSDRRSSQDGGQRKQFYRPSIIKAPAILVLLVIIVGLIILVEYACRTSPTESFRVNLSVSMGSATLNARSVPLASSSALADQPPVRMFVAREPPPASISSSTQAAGGAQGSSSPGPISPSSISLPSALPSSNYIASVTSQFSLAVGRLSPTTATGGKQPTEEAKITTTVSGYIPPTTKAVEVAQVSLSFSAARKGNSELSKPPEDFLSPTTAAQPEPKIQASKTAVSGAYNTDKTSTVGTDRTLPSDTSSVGKKDPVQGETKTILSGARPTDKTSTVGTDRTLPSDTSAVDKQDPVQDETKTIISGARLTDKTSAVSIDRTLPSETSAVGKKDPIQGETKTIIPDARPTDKTSTVGTDRTLPSDTSAVGKKDPVQGETKTIISGAHPTDKTSTVGVDRTLPSNTSPAAKVDPKQEGSTTIIPGAYNTGAVSGSAYIPPGTLYVGLSSGAGGYLPPGVTSLGDGVTPLDPTAVKQNQPLVTTGPAGPLDPSNGQTAGNTIYVSFSSNGYIGSKLTTLLPGETLSPEATGGSRGGVQAAQATDLKAAKPTNTQPTLPVSLLRPGSLYTTTNAQGSVIVATAGVTQYITKVSTDSKGQVHTDLFVKGTLTTRTTTDATGGVRTLTQTAEASRAATTYGPNAVNRPVRNLTAWGYFMGSYIPILIAILLRITIGVLYAAVKMMEPFITLANHSGGGVLAKDFLNINYLATNELFDPFVALYNGHWFMFFTTVLYVTVELITPFASEFSSLYYFCNSNGLCGPEIRVKPTVGRIIETLLGATAIMLIAFLFIERKHRSGVFADPSSISTMATLFHQPQVVEDFMEINAGASKKDMEQMLVGKRYCLDYYEHKDGTERYGIVAMRHEAMSVVGGTRDRYAQLRHSESNHAVTPSKHQQRQRTKHSIYRLARECLLGLLTAGILIIVVWYYTNSDQDNTFEKFINGQNFGPRFVFSIFGILIQGQWKRLERGKLACCALLSQNLNFANKLTEVCIIQPFRSLGSGGVSAEKSILISRSLDPLTGFIASIPRRHIYCALVALTSIFSEVLIVTLAGVPFNAGQLLIAFKVSAYISIGILGIMLIMQVVIYLRPRGPALPRTPNTLGAVFSYLCASPLLEDFGDMALLDEKKKRVRVRDMGRKYMLDVMEGADGKARWQIAYDNSGLQPA
ncbi:MAG: hypothetical protein M1814_003605 [Vezdaea aestivalis]|nr:MAG: hypothetical protein M1814_003605 [Vezdaea aestivalis]